MPTIKLKLKAAQHHDSLLHFLLVTMESLPGEICDTIFGLSCSDGGKAGCALSLVSRRVHVLSRPWRYQNIALIGTRAIQCFAGLAVQQANKGNCASLDVRELFIADIEERPPLDRDLAYTYAAHKFVDSTWYQSPYNAPHRAKDTRLKILGMRYAPWKRRHLRDMFARAQIFGLNAALIDILTACAPTLRALSLNLITYPAFLLLPDVPMPVLEDLTLTARPLLPIWTIGGWGGLSPEQSLPRTKLSALRHIEVISTGFPFDDGYQPTLDSIVTAAPNITHVRMGTWGEPRQLTWTAFWGARIRKLPPGIDRVDILATIGWAELEQLPEFDAYQEAISEARVADGESARVWLVFNGEWNAYGLAHLKARVAHEYWNRRICEGRQPPKTEGIAFNWGSKPDELDDDDEGDSDISSDDGTNLP
jgi:hypothetical protein